MIRMNRLERGMTAAEAAERAGVSRTTVNKIENGEMGSEIGLVFEVSAIVGVRLFGTEDPATLSDLVSGRLALLPRRVHPEKVKVVDDF